MRRSAILFVLIMITNYPCSVISQENRPLNLNDIGNFLKSGGISDQVTIRLLTERGINFILNEEETNRLRNLGATDDVIDVLIRETIKYQEENLSSLSIKSEPPGARVSIDGVPYVGKTPLKIEKLASGTKKLVVDGVEGYGKFESEL